MQTLICELADAAAEAERRALYENAPDREQCPQQRRFRGPQQAKTKADHQRAGWPLDGVLRSPRRAGADPHPVLFSD